MAWQWIVGALVALGGLVFTVAKADLEDVDVYRWLARKLIDRAAQRLPHGERDRWRDESTQNVLDLPGRLPPVFWALDTYMRSGSWGRMRGAPSRWQVLIARVRAAWLWLRSLPTARARARERQVQTGPKRLPPSIRVQADAAQVAAVAFTTRSGSATLAGPRRWWEGRGMMHLSDAEFIAWLAQERQQFEDDVDQKVEAWLRREDRILQQFEDDVDRKIEAWYRREDRLSRR
jgi:hypothetical protein